MWCLHEGGIEGFGLERPEVEDHCNNARLNTQRLYLFPCESESFAP